MEDLEKDAVLYHGKDYNIDQKVVKYDLKEDISQVYIPVYKDISKLTYSPFVIGFVEVFYHNTKFKVAETKHYTLITPIMEGPVSIDWSKGQTIDLEPEDLNNEADVPAYYKELPSAASIPKNYDKWKRLLSQYVRKEFPLSLYYSPTLKEYSKSDEDERAFRIRAQHIAYEIRDEAIDKLKKKYDSKITTLENRLLRATQNVDKKTSQASQRKVDAAVSVGTALFGAIIDKKVSKTSVSKIGTALKSSNRAIKSGKSVEQAEETLLNVQAQLEELQDQLEQEIKKINESYDIENEEIEVIEIMPTANNIIIHFIGLAWNPEYV